VQVGHYEADLVVEQRLLLELKATYHVTDVDRRRVLNYLRASKLEVALLLHFGPSARFERVVFATGGPRCSRIVRSSTYPRRKVGSKVSHQREHERWREPPAISKSERALGLQLGLRAEGAQSWRLTLMLILEDRARP
jgi:hypothetical protein